VETTPGDVAENHRAAALVAQHEQTTGQAVQTVVADRQYGTAENYQHFHQRGVVTHLAPLPAGPLPAERGLFRRAEFRYDPARNVYTCPAGQTLFPGPHDTRRHSTKYQTRQGVCAARTMHPVKGPPDPAPPRPAGSGGSRFGSRAQRGGPARLAPSPVPDRRQFRPSRNLHHFKHARWRRLWRQQIQAWLIAAIQNIKLWLRHARPKPAVANAPTLSTSRNFIAQLVGRTQSYVALKFHAAIPAF
jgi:hypothetical protein